jgi:hypothetical protein
MIGFFPEPYPDELCYSLCARYCRRAGYRGRISTVRDLFGSGSFRAVVDMPSRLDYLIASLPPGHGYTVDRFIDEHTLLPFYAAFFPPERVARVRAEMRQSSGQAKAHIMAGLSEIAKRFEYLRYCPMCAEEDRERYGEAYWRRIHQVSKVKVCHSHGLLLESSGVHATYRVDREEFVTLDELLPMGQKRAPDRGAQSDRSHVFNLAIASDARWLLDQRGLCSTSASLRRRYLNLLYDCGLATATDLVRLRALRYEFESHYGRDFLESLDCKLASHALAFKYLMRNEGQTGHPVEHLLLIHYLGYSAQEFFLLAGEKRQPFGAPPWPCLNSASDHYRELRIEKCKIRDLRTNLRHQQRKSFRKPVGEFACDCGFVYRRVGPDASEEDRYKITQIEEFGSIWESKLRELRLDGAEHTIGEIARRLGVDRHTLMEQEQRLGLRPRKEKDGSEVFASPRPHRREQLRLEKEEKRRKYREQWLRAVEEDPETDLLTLKTKLPAAYNWFYKNDDHWMRTHTPRHHIEKKAIDIDWGARDIELAVAVRRSAARLMNAPGRPVWISADAIGRDTGKRHRALSRDDRLPLTNQALIEVIESREDWAIRRIRWAVECYRQEGVCATERDVLARASVTFGYMIKRGIRPIVEEAIRSLCPFSQSTD